MTTLLFNVAGLAIIGWALMILLPGWSVTKHLARSRGSDLGSEGGPARLSR